MASKKGIIYLMTTAVSGLVKIGKTDSFQERMRNLEANGYYNVAGLKKAFAIMVDDYDDKEDLLKEIFAKHRVGNSELFALDDELVKQLLLSFEGTVIYPEEPNKEKAFNEITNLRKKGALFSFYKKGIKNGDIITFYNDKDIVAKVVDERDVEYEGVMFKLSPLTKKLLGEKGKLNASGAYRGADYWCFNNRNLAKLKDIM